MNITLGWSELQHAAFVGCQRRIRALARGRRTTSGHGTPPNDIWGNDVAAAAAELAVAKALDRYWADSSDPDYAGDVGKIHVRSTPLEDGCLVLHRDDPDDAVFVLACGKPPIYNLAGWLRAGEGKRDAFWRPDLARPCFLVPQRALRDVAELLR